MLEGKGILITGAGSGIGRAAATVFASYGARLVLADINGDAVTEATREIISGGGEAYATVVDTGLPDQIDAMVSFAANKLGRIDSAFNNVGIAHALASIKDMPLAMWQRTLDITLTGTFLSIQAELKHMVEQGGGSIVNTASNSGKHGTPMLGAYSAAKFGVVSLTMTTAVEFATQGIRVNAICPGVIDTPPIAALAAGGTNFADIVKAPMARMGTATEVAELAAWLCSPRSSYVTGQAISIDGGSTAMP